MTETNNEKPVKDVKEQIQEIKQLIKDSYEKLEELSLPYFKQGAMQLFIDHPCLLGFTWSQYIPSFDDEDGCTLTSTADCPDIYFKKRGETSEYSEEKDEDFDENENVPEELAEGVKYEKYGPFEPNDEEQAAIEAVESFLNEFDDDQLERLFGDATQIVVTAKGFSKEDYYYG